MELWNDLIKRLEKNGVDIKVCSTMLREFLIRSVDVEYDLEFYFGEPKSVDEINQMIDDVTDFQIENNFL